MVVSCPLNFKKVDENLSRINTFIIIVLVMAYLYISSLSILLFLIFDFFIKLFFEKLSSPIMFISIKFKNILGLKDRLVDGGAKRLAGFFGLSFMGLLLVGYFMNSESLTLFIASIYLTCALLDLFFRFCIGCKIYFIIKKIYPNFMNEI